MEELLNQASYLSRALVWEVAKKGLRLLVWRRVPSLTRALAVHYTHFHNFPMLRESAHVRAELEALHVLGVDGIGWHHTEKWKATFFFTARALAFVPHSLLSSCNLFCGTSTLQLHYLWSEPMRRSPQKFKAAMLDLCHILGDALAALHWMHVKSIVALITFVSTLASTASTLHTLISIHVSTLYLPIPRHHLPIPRHHLPIPPLMSSQT